ncbi:hypothetical protein Lsan_4128 [Legionella santicrucis]|uniref:Uncharacterized protein n=1 Tax=Legionella santicrucis TaxID=45074 RepID=A0A0W0YAR9_9GAMM|nr:hypothetical protein [Legionella santicrucis]KTD53718.1 hypothetical protein Lsan_4128 [Legionella santicrucis]
MDKQINVTDYIIQTLLKKDIDILSLFENNKFSIENSGPDFIQEISKIIKRYGCDFEVPREQFLYGFTEEENKFLKSFKCATIDPRNDSVLLIFKNLTGDNLRHYKSNPDEYCRRRLSGQSNELHRFSQYFEGKKHEQSEYYKDESHFISKRCKLGILWLLSRGNTLNFVLNNTDMRIAFKKPAIFTYHELRFIYRHWQDLLPYYQSGKLKFWQQDSQSGAWQQVAPSWCDPSEKQNFEKLYQPKQLKAPLYRSFFDSQSNKTESLKIVNKTNLSLESDISDKLSI